MSENSLPSKKRNRLPIPKDRDDRAKAALRRLDIDLDELASAPQITPLLKHADGGLKAVLSAMRFASEDPEIGPFLEKYDSIPADDRARLSWEAIAIAAEVNIRHLLGAIQLAAQAHSVNTVKIIAVTSHPKITRARVKFGQLAGGEKDRTALDTAMGFLPSPKGPTFIGKAIFGGHTTSDASEKEDNTESGVYNDTGEYNDLFPDAEIMQEKLISLRQKLLE